MTALASNYRVFDLPWTPADLEQQSGTGLGG